MSFQEKVMTWVRNVKLKHVRLLSEVIITFAQLDICLTKEKNFIN